MGKWKNLKLKLKINKRILDNYRKRKEELEITEKIIKKETNILQNKNKKLLKKYQKTTSHRDFDLLRDEKLQFQDFVTKWFRNTNKIETNLESYDLTFNHIREKR